MNQVYEGFELFLEGRLVPFSSITIQEAENQYPQASISFAASDDATRILAGTIVQVFGPFDGEKILMFEGEVTAVNYEKSSNGRVASISCMHILNRTLSANVRPKDSLISNRRKAIEGVYTGGNKYFVIDASQTNTAAPDDKEQNTESKKTEKTTDEINISTYAPFLSGFTQLLNGVTDTSKKILNGELNYFFDFFFNFFEQYDLFYKIISKGFRLRDSIFAWPNPGKIKIFKTKTILNRASSFMSNIAARQGETNIKLFDLLVQGLQTFNYTMVCPSSPTRVSQFWDKGDKYGPLRLQFNPSMENSPPILPNVFFPPEVSAYNYSHPMFAEPTRMVGTFSLPGGDGRYAIKGLMPMTVVPQLNVTGDSLLENTTSFTTEESYRGIFPTVEYLDYFMTDTYLKAQMDSPDSEETPNVDDAEEFDPEVVDSRWVNAKGVGEAFVQETYRRFLKSKYQQRSFTLSCSWNPSRLVGYNGVVVEQEGPSVMGVISSITTNIDSNGSASSSVTFRAPRLVRPFEPEQGLIDDYTTNGVIDLNRFIFDPEFYGYINIGEDLYNFNVSGTARAGSDKLGPDSDYDGFESYRGKMSSMPTTNNRDSSILSLIKDKDGKIINPVVDLEGPKAKVYTKLLEQSIAELINQYKQIKDTTEDHKIPTRLNGLWKRNLITKTEYFDFVGVALNETLTEAAATNYADKDNILSSLENIKKLKDAKLERSKSKTFYLNEKQKELNSLLSDYERIKEIKNNIKAGQKFDTFREGFGLIERSTYRDVYSKYSDGSLFNGSVEEQTSKLRTEYDLLRENPTKSILYQIEEKALTKIEETEKQIEEFKEGSTEQENTLENQAIKMYNKNRRDHVDKAFSKYSSQRGIKVIK